MHKLLRRCDQGIRELGLASIEGPEAARHQVEETKPGRLDDPEMLANIGRLSQNTIMEAESCSEVF